MCIATVPQPTWPQGVAGEQGSVIARCFREATCSKTNEGGDGGGRVVKLLLSGINRMCCDGGYEGTCMPPLVGGAM